MLVYGRNTQNVTHVLMCMGAAGARRALQRLMAAVAAARPDRYAATRLAPVLLA
jgi:hypothetical protein